MCDLTDPRIVEAYTAIINNEPTNWLLLGYHDTRDVVSLYSVGTEGLSEFRDNLVNEVLYGFVRVDDRFILITWVSDQVSGVRKARALVHSRSVAALLKQHDAQITASTLTDLSDANIRNRLKLSLRRSSTKEELFVADQTTPDQQQLEEEAKQAAAREAEEEGRRIAAELEAQRIEQERILFERQLEEERILREQREAQRLEEERILQEKQELERLEQERIAREKEERERLEEEKKLLQMKLLEAEKNKSVLLSGFVSVQPSTSPFWKRRYFVLQGKSMAFYNDELQANPVLVLDLNKIERLGATNVDTETFVPNAFVLETQLNGSYQLFADNKSDLQTILTTLETIN